MNDQKQALDLEAVEQRREAAFEWVFAMCKGETRFKMSIPYEETDTDAILCAALKDSETLEAENAQLHEVLDHLLDACHRGMYSARETIEAVEAAEGLLATITGEPLTSEELEARALRRYRERLSQRVAETEVSS